LVGLDRQLEQELERTYRRSTIIFFRLLVSELARSDRFSPLTPGPEPATEEPAYSEYREGRLGRLSPPLPAWERGLGGEGRTTTSAVEEARAVARDLACATTSPHEILSTLYEDVLRYRCRIDPAHGAAYLERSDSERKANGSFYTPRHIARPVVEAALDPLIHRSGGGTLPLLRILDPAMGTGVFLLEAVLYLASRKSIGKGWNAATIAEHCLYGIDFDPVAVELAVLSLWLETGARPAVVARHLRRGSLLGEADVMRVGRFDAVIGNPPWGAHYDPEERKELELRFPRSTGGSFDSFKLFLDLASSLSRGTVGMVVPQAVLAQPSHTDIREVLLELKDPYWAMNLGDGIFAGAAAPACAVVFGPKPGPRSVPCVDGRGVTRVPATLWDTKLGFPLKRPGIADLLRRLRSHHPTFGELAHLYRVRDVGINYNRASVAERVLYSGPESAHALDVQRYRGRNFDRYTSISPGGWLRHDAQRLLQQGESVFLDWSTYTLPEKIVLRQTADRIVATLDRSRMAMGRSVIAITREADVSLQALLACLNSRLLTVLYRSLAGEEGRVLPQVKVGRIKDLPIPRVCALPFLVNLHAYCGGFESDSPVHQTQSDPHLAWLSLHHLANVLLRSQGRDPGASALVDRIVYRLYGLTPEEIALVEAV